MLKTFKTANESEGIGGRCKPDCPVVDSGELQREMILYASWGITC